MESGRLEEEKLLVWNRLPGYNFVLVLFSILIIVIFCHLSLLCLKMALEGLKLVAANITSSSQECLWFLVLCIILTIFTISGFKNSYLGMHLILNKLHNTSFDLSQCFEFCSNSWIINFSNNCSFFFIHHIWCFLVNQLPWDSHPMRISQFWWYPQLCGQNCHHSPTFSWSRWKICQPE